MKINIAQVLLGLVLLLILASPAWADINSDLSANQSKQQQLQDLINNSKNQADTLQNQINSLNNQIELAQLQVDAKQAELDGITTDITSLTSQISDLETKLNTLAKVAVERFRVSQAEQNAVPLESIMIGNNLSVGNSNLAYQQYIQHKDNVIFKEMDDLKQSLGAQKLVLKDKQSQVSQVRDQLASAKSQLDGSKASKVSLLQLTQNNEANYQRMLVAAKREAEQIILAYNNKSGAHWVNRGDPVGTEGCTGYCFGPHLHFGLYTQPYDYNKSLNPCRVLACNVQGNGGTVSSGGYRVPLEYNGDGTGYASVSQWWGMTWFARPPYNGYGGGIHPGIDMYTYQGDVVHAAASGMAYIYRGGQANGNGVFIYHPDGYVTEYWHLN